MAILSTYCLQRRNWHKQEPRVHKERLIWVVGGWHLCFIRPRAGSTLSKHPSYLAACSPVSVWPGALFWGSSRCWLLSDTVPFQSHPLKVLFVLLGWKPLLLLAFSYFCTQIWNVHWMPFFSLNSLFSWKSWGCSLQVNTSIIILDLPW